MSEQPSLFPEPVTPSECLLVEDDRIERFEEWVKTIRDPAELAREGLRRIEAGRGRAYAEYDIATLPDGRFAVHVSCAYKTGDHFGRAVPWTAFPTREECLEFFLETARQHFGSEKGVDWVREDMQARLRSTLIGFVEPAAIARPETRQN